MAVDDIVTDGWEQQAEILSRAVAKSGSMFEVPISYYGRTYGEEGNQGPPRTCRHLDDPHQAVFIMTGRGVAVLVRY